MAKTPERMEDLPPKVQEALKRKGWTYPPDEKMKKQWEEAGRRFRPLSNPVEIEVLRELYRERGWTHLERYLEQQGKKRKCQEREDGSDTAQLL